MRRLIAAVPWLLLTVAVADLVGLRMGVVSHGPEVLAGLFGATAVALAASLTARLVVAARAPEGRRRALAAILATAGALVVVLGGSLNWLRGLQGFVVLTQGQVVELRGGTALQAFEAGPWARIDEMEVVVSLDELALEPTGGGRFTPVSRLRVWRGHDPPERLELSPFAAASSGSLRFHQGAFGFAPRIVILHGTDPARTAFDRVVPFTSHRRGPSGVSFEGRFTVGDEGLGVAGAVDLASLDEGLRGHATLHLELRHDGRPLGSGSLLPGHFAEVDEGYRVGFVDLERWSEVLVSRRSYSAVMLVGAGMVVVGGLVALAGHWRRR